MGVGPPKPNCLSRQAGKRAVRLSAMESRRRSTDGRPRPPGPESARRPGDNQPPKTGFGNWRAWVLLAVFVVANVLLAPILFPETSDRVTIPYTTFKEQVQAGNVSEIT